MALLHALIVQQAGNVQTPLLVLLHALQENTLLLDPLLVRRVHQAPTALLLVHM